MGTWDNYSNYICLDLQTDLPFSVIIARKWWRSQGHVSPKVWLEEAPFSKVSRAYKIEAHGICQCLQKSPLAGLHGTDFRVSNHDGWEETGRTKTTLSQVKGAVLGRPF